VKNIVFPLIIVALAAATADAQIAGAAPPRLPRTADGKPDLSGIWQVMNTAVWDIQDHNAQKGVPAGLGVVDGNDLPYKPEAGFSTPVSSTYLFS
jgi:hypothetical protein